MAALADEQVAAAAVPVPVMSVVGNASLYVGDLDMSINEAQLCDLFSRVAPVVSVRVCRDKSRHTSLGYAYVNFSTPHDAAMAREKLNFTPLKGKAMRIMFSHRDPSMRKSGFGNIFIKNLDPSIDNKALLETFTSFGNVLSCKVATDSSGLSKGHGYVQFDNDESAQMAIRKLDGMLMNDKKVYVGLFIRRHERNMGNCSRKFTNIYVKNLLEATTDEDLKSMFGKFGVITSAIVMKDSDGGSRCFGFVNFENTGSAAEAINGLNGTDISEGRILYVARAQKKSEREAELRAQYEQERRDRFEKLQEANLYLKNLDDSINEESVKELFAEFGTITSCKILRNPQGISNGAGFVAFSTTEEAAKAMRAMNGKMVVRKPMYVAVAQRKEERRAQLQTQFSQVRAAFPMPGFHPGASRLSPQQLFYGQGMQTGGILPHQHGGYGYQQPFITGLRPTTPPNFMIPPMQFQGGQNGQRMGPRRGGTFQPVQQQWMLRKNDEGGRYTSDSRHSMSPSLMSNEQAGTSLSHYPGSQLPISSLAAATLENQQAMLGEQLFPLVKQLEPDNAGKVTGMLLEMDQTEVLHLIESPEALKKKTSEAIEALRKAAVSDGPDDTEKNS